MSAYRDISQKIGWSYSNFYKLYKGFVEPEPKVTGLEPLKQDLTKLQTLHAELVSMIDDLEKSLKE